MKNINKSYSGEGQDIFALSLLNKVKIDDFSFLDVGCAEPFNKSNGSLFDEIGCSGLFIDKDSFNYNRRNFYQCDVHSDYFDNILKIIFRHINYLSIDVDGASGVALEKIINHKKTFDILTFEHELCCGNLSLKNFSTKILKENGYLCLFENVHYDKNKQTPFEDWWINPKYQFEKEHLKLIQEKKNNDKAFCDLYWEDILKLI